MTDAIELSRYLAPAIFRCDQTRGFRYMECILTKLPRPTKARYEVSASVLSSRKTYNRT